MVKPVFHDELAQQALETAIAEHTKLLRDNRELQASRDALVSEIQTLESELEQLATRPHRQTMALSVSGIDAAVNSQESRRTELETSRDAAVRRLRLTDDARTRLSGKIANQRESVREKRAALAAAFERWTLSQPVVKEAINHLCLSRAVWDATLGGCLDVEQWSVDLLYDHVPSDSQYSYARKLLVVEDE